MIIFYKEYHSTASRMIARIGDFNLASNGDNERAEERTLEITNAKFHKEYSDKVAYHDIAIVRKLLAASEDRRKHQSHMLA